MSPSGVLISFYHSQLKVLFLRAPGSRNKYFERLFFCLMNCKIIKDIFSKLDKRRTYMKILID